MIEQNIILLFRTIRDLVCPHPHSSQITAVVGSHWHTTCARHALVLRRPTFRWGVAGAPEQLTWRPKMYSSVVLSI